MDSFEWNKIAGAVLGTLVLVMGVGFLAEAIYEPIQGAGPGYALPEPDAEGHGGGEPVEVEIVPLPVLLASASVDDGARVARKCQSCHTFEEGGDNKTGPALYDVVGRTLAAVDGFAYSDVLVEMGGNGTVWTYDDLNAFLEAPKAYAPGTKMTFAGLRSETERADLLVYLQSLSASPVPLPAVEETAPAEEEMVAEGDMSEEPMADEEMTDADMSDADMTEDHGDMGGEAMDESAPAEEPAAMDEPMAEEPAAEDASMDEAMTDETMSDESMTMESEPMAEEDSMTDPVEAINEAAGAGAEEMALPTDPAPMDPEPAQ